jgi:uncharacterized membrane protein YphA (DoxX/SURF4 family)
MYGGIIDAISRSEFSAVVARERRFRCQGRTMFTLLPPFWLIRVAVAAVWLYEGLWCKLLRGQPHELEVVEAVPYFGPRFGALFLMALGVLEVALGAWVLTGIEPWWCALVQTLLLVTLNVNGLIWSRHIIHDPAGMVVKNSAFLVLVWVAAGLPQPW